MKKSVKWILGGSGRGCGFCGDLFSVWIAEGQVRAGAVRGGDGEYRAAGAGGNGGDSGAGFYGAG